MIRAQASKLQNKAAGLDNWSGAEIQWLPDPVLEIVASHFLRVEAGEDWHSGLRQWRQCHVVKPNRTGIGGLRPLSIGSIWYRIYTGIRISHLRTFIASQVPDAQHGGIQRCGVHTALAMPMCLLETGKAAPRDHFKFFGSADLNKAYDRMHPKFALAALRRIPHATCTALKAAWLNQARWMQACGHCAKTPDMCANLPQGDAASVVALVAPLSEALRRIQQNHTGTKHAVYLDDRSWVTKRPTEAAAIGQAWSEEMSRLHLEEDNSKKAYAAISSRHEKSLRQALEATGHTADPAFVFGADQTAHILSSFCPEFEECWFDKKNIGPVSLVRDWLNRHGWIEDPAQPWSWTHDQIPDALSPQVAQNRPELLHILRRAWRGQQWQEFLSGNSRAAAALHPTKWHQVETAWEWARVLIGNNPPLRNHPEAIFTNRWVSDTRLLVNQNNPVAICERCNQGYPTREHQWWERTQLAADRSEAEAHRARHLTCRGLPWVSASCALLALIVLSGRMLAPTGSFQAFILEGWAPKLPTCKQFPNLDFLWVAHSNLNHMGPDNGAEGLVYRVRSYKGEHMEMVFNAMHDFKAYDPKMFGLHGFYGSLNVMERSHAHLKVTFKDWETKKPVTVDPHRQ
eukprot:s365_g16.t1